MTVVDRPGSLESLSRRASELQDAPITWLMQQALQVPGVLSLAAGFVDQSTLPAREVAAIAHDLLMDPVSGPRSLQYGTTEGLPRLRGQLLERMRSAAPVWNHIDVDDLIVTGGSQQLLYLLTEALVDPGDVVLVENPTYFVQIGVLEGLGAKVVGVEADGRGLVPEALDGTLARLFGEGRLPAVKMLYSMPYSQNPNGSTLSADRRPRVFEILRSWRDRGLGATLVEDAAYRHVRFPGVDDLPPLFELQEENDFVCYLESFSKVLSPGLRVGYGVLPKSVLRSVSRLKSLHDFGTCNFSQSLVSRILDDGLFERHLERLRERYRDKCNLLFDLLSTELAGLVDLEVPCGGLYLWLTMRGDIETGMAGDLFQRALAEKVLYVPGDVCAVEGGDPERRSRRSMRLCYAYPSDEELIEAGRRLVRAIRAVA